MKLIIFEYPDGRFEVAVLDDMGISLQVFTYDDKAQAKAFCSGFNCGKSVANSLIQSMPMSYEEKKADSFGAPYA